MVSPFVLKSLELGPSALFNIIDDVRPEKYRERLGDDRFDLVEMVAHVADLEDVFLDRLRLAKEHPGSEVPGIDPTVRAVEKNYAERDLYHELEVFRNRRNDTLDFLKNLEPGEDKGTVILPMFGEIDIAFIAAGILAHDLYHVEQASRYLK